MTLENTPTKKNVSLCHLPFHHKPHLDVPALKPDLLCERPAGNHLSHGTAASFSKAIFQYAIKTINKIRKPWK